MASIVAFHMVKFHMVKSAWANLFGNENHSHLDVKGGCTFFGTPCLIVFLYQYLNPNS
jgi:hypothetical protein